MKYASHNSRRGFLKESSVLLTSCFVLRPVLNLYAAAPRPEGFRPLFDGKTLAGWHGKPRTQGLPKGEEKHEENSGRWVVEDGIIIGGQEPPGSGIGGY